MHVSGNAINSAGLETDLINILEPASNTTSSTNTTTETTAEAPIVFEMSANRKAISEHAQKSMIFDNSSNGQASNAPGENASASAATESAQKQEEQSDEDNEKITITDTTHNYISQTAENKFTIYTTDEDEIIKEIEEKTKIDKDKIKKAI